RSGHGPHLSMEWDGCGWLSAVVNTRARPMFRAAPPYGPADVRASGADPRQWRTASGPHPPCGRHGHPPREPHLNTVFASLAAVPVVRGAATRVPFAASLAVIGVCGAGPDELVEPRAAPRRSGSRSGRRKGTAVWSPVLPDGLSPMMVAQHGGTDAGVIRAAAGRLAAASCS